MNGLGLHVQRRASRIILALGAFVCSPAFGEEPKSDAGAAPAAPTSAPASPTSQPAAAAEPVSPTIVAARELFREATNDFDAGRVADALEKFRRVASVRETAQVRFNIAKCEESLGMLATAMGDFELAERDAPLDAKGEEVARLAREHAGAIRAQVPRLIVVPPAGAPEGFSVTLDGERVPPASMNVPLPVDPGPHVVLASAPGRPPFRREVQVAPARSERVAVELAALPAGEEPIPSTHEGNPRRTAGVVLLGAGAALAVTSVVFVVLHNGNVSDINSACPTLDACLPSHQAAYDDARSAALRNEALAVTFGIASAVGVGLGIYFVASSGHRAQTPPPTAWLTPGAPGAPAGASLLGRF